ncbi:hypothetical protein C8J57DRAFT_1502217 [Mycena rebaudengoi]|nr:hypothetical protein C8J57DRAFT_1502217 [Mycena rebaudengoi]
MFGLTTILSASVSILLASQSVLAVPNQDIARSLSLRQTTTGFPSGCASQCQAVTDSLTADPDLSKTCSDATMDKLAGCYDCAAASGTDKATLQSSADLFASGCKSAGHPVKSVTIGATKKGGAQRVSAGAAGVVESVGSVNAAA